MKLNGHIETLIMFVPSLSTITNHKCMKKVEDIRRDYRSLEFDIKRDVEDPFKLFEKWFREAVEKEKYEPNAMALSTVSEDGKPSSRFVLLKHFDSTGFVFYTNYSSRKSKQLETTPYAALAFYWPILERQIRIEGPVSRLSDNDSDLYFDSRPNGSKIGAWASPQSQPIPSRD